MYILAEALRDHPGSRDQLSDEIIQLLFKSALHDVGKVATPDAILLKPGKLTPDEVGADEAALRIWPQRHPCRPKRPWGVTDASFPQYAAEIAYGHHERWDGSGYPRASSGMPSPRRA